MADDEENSETPTRPVPEVVVISRQVFNQPFDTTLLYIYIIIFEFIQYIF